MLQRWLPEDYVLVTKDVDIYVSSPNVPTSLASMRSRLARKFERAGFTVSVHETGGIKIVESVAGKPIEILYLVADIYMLRSLLRETVVIEGLKVLEVHAVVVAKALGDEYSLLRVADELVRRGNEVNVSRLLMLAGKAAKELRGLGDSVAASKLLRRIKKFVGASKLRASIQ